MSNQPDQTANDTQGSHLSNKPWLPSMQAHARKYLTLFAQNPGVQKIAAAFDPQYLRIQDPNERLDYLVALASREWDFRKNRERYEITETFAIDAPDSELGKLVHEGARQAEMASASSATLKHYTVMAILGGANKSPYNRLKYALEQPVTYDTLAYLGSEREVLAPEQAQTKDYAPGARTEFDLGVGAFKTLLGSQITTALIYEKVTPECRVAYMQQRNNVPILLLSAAPHEGRKRANTADTYDFLRQWQALGPNQNILFATSAVYRYAQYFDALRDISLKTGADIEVIGFAPEYAGIDFKPSQFLQELKSAADAALRLRNAVESAA